jgi:hypothetical protein
MCPYSESPSVTWQRPVHVEVNDGDRRCIYEADSIS